LVALLKELAQNGVRREAVPDMFGGARRTLCASCRSRLGYTLEGLHIYVALFELKMPPIRVACVMIWYENEIVEPDDDALFLIGSQIQIDMVPMTTWR
jgi:hypothetical protein